jgi:DNA-binding XRE family transcriptional regulator
MQALRAEGLAFAEIGRWLGVTASCVQSRLAGVGRVLTFPCCLCRSAIPGRGSVPRERARARCVACVTADPDAGFGDYLLAFRLAAGLTKQELAARAGVCEESVARYEDGRDAWWSVALKLLRALGVPLTLTAEGQDRPSGNRRRRGTK